MEFPLVDQTPLSVWKKANRCMGTVGVNRDDVSIGSPTNLDILLLIMLAPGLLMVNEGYRRQARLDREIARAVVQPGIQHDLGRK